jgi:hypothetical protein
MAKKITRRSFLKGTGKTILTAGVLSSGIGLSTSTTPTTVVPKAMSWKNLNVLSPKAKAYRTYLKGIKTMVGSKALKGMYGTTQSHKGRFRDSIDKDFQKKSPARKAFEESTRKPDKLATYSKGGKTITPKLERATHGSPSTGNLANNLAPGRPWSERVTDAKRLEWNKASSDTKTNLTKTARSALAKELRKRRKMRADLVKRGLVDKRKNTKMKSGGGGGGKGALPGSQSAKNPTGMSLITQRYTL